MLLAARLSAKSDAIDVRTAHWVNWRNILAVIARLTGSSSQTEPNALDNLSSLCAIDMARVNQLIVDRMQSNVPLIPELAGHLVAAGGKRLRYRVRGCAGMKATNTSAWLPPSNLSTPRPSSMTTWSTNLNCAVAGTPPMRFGAIRQAFLSGIFCSADPFA